MAMKGSETTDAKEKITVITPEMSRKFWKRVWLEAGLMFLGIAVFGILSSWVGRKIERDANRAVFSQASIASYSRAVAVLAELRSKEKEVEAYANRLNALLPARDDLIELPKFLEELGRIHQVNIRFSFRGGAATEPSGTEPGSVAFSIDATGSYERLQRFFSEMEAGSTKFISVLDSLDVNLVGNEYRAIAQGRAFFK